MKSSREQFEEWFIKQYPKSRNGVATWSGEDDGDYISDYAASHWLAWQASRAAIVIELPWLGQSSLMETDDVVEAIELQGLTAKAKP